MKIALVVHKYPPYSLGGTEVYTRNLALELARRGHEPVVYFRADFDARTFAARDEKIEGIRTRRISAPLLGWRSCPLVEFYRTFRNPDIERDFRAFLERERPDVVHFQHVMALSARLLLLTRELGYPTLLTLHDYWFICANAQLIWPDAQVCRGKAWGLNCARCALARFEHPLTTLARPALATLFWYRDAVVRRAALTAQRFIAPSHFLLERYVQAGFPAQLCVYLENGVDLARLQGYPPVPATDGRVRFTYLGSLAWQKGVHVLVEAFKEIPADKATLVIYGNPQTFPDYVARLQQIANSDNTTFAGPIPNTEVRRVLASTDVIVVPSVWYENSPVVIQEAFAARVPILASDVGALPEKVGTSGRLFPVGDVDGLREILWEIVTAGGLETQRIAVPQSISESAGHLLNIYATVGGLK